MQAFGILLILGGLMLGRQIFTGRVKETASDARDITLSVLTGDFDRLGTVLSQRGENVPADVSSVVAADTSAGASTQESLEGLLLNPIRATLLAEMVRLGNAATGGYVWGATGPTSYDCSGLVWQAMKNTGVYSGSRFTTSTFVKTLGSKIAQVQSPETGDIVLWPGTHIGVVSSPGQFYSAKSPKSGIGYAPISSVPGSPVYYRVGKL